MNAQEAIAAAKRYVTEVFASEDVINIGLEEIRFRDHDDVWEITIGFTRPWEKDKIEPTIGRVLGGWPPAYLKDGKPMPRVFKKVELRDSDAKVLGLSDRPLAA